MTLYNTRPTLALRPAAAATLLAFAVLGLSWATPSAAQTAPTAPPSDPTVALPADLPPYGKDKPLPVPQVTQRRLVNGLQVWVVPRQGPPRVDFVLAVRGAGSAADPPDQPGFASLMAGLLTEGTARRSGRDIAETAQGLGGGVGAGSAPDGVFVGGYALASKAAPMLQLLAEVARQPMFAREEVQLAKANALQGLLASQASPGYLAERALSKLLYGSHPYGNTLPTAEAIESATADALRDAHARRFRPDRSLLVIVGRIEVDRALALAEMTFGDWRPMDADAPALPDAPAVGAGTDAARVLVNRAGSVQATVRLGRPAVAATHPDHIPLRMAGVVLGGGLSSRLMLNLREDKGYTYGASAGVRAHRAGGAVVGGAEVRNEVVGPALQEFLAEYKRLGDQPVPAAELQATKRQLAGDYLIGNQLQSAVGQTLARNWLVGLPPQALGSFVPRVEQVTAGRLQQVARTYFAPERQSIVVVGDGTALADSLKPFGDFKATPP